MYSISETRNSENYTKTVSPTWLFIPIPAENSLFWLLVNHGHGDIGIVQGSLENVLLRTVLICHNALLFFNSGSELSTEFLQSSKGSPTSFKKQGWKSPCCEAQGNAGILWTTGDWETWSWHFGDDAKTQMWYTWCRAVRIHSRESQMEKKKSDIQVTFLNLVQKVINLAPQLLGGL